MENLKLWDSVVKTDPSATKKFTKGGGFSGTAIKPYWLIKRATETFGVCGIGWGWTEIENQFVAGIWCSKVQLWYTHNNQRGTIEQWGQTVMEGTNKNGRFVDEEAPKKAVTDAVTKCLSYLGFAGDVHMGLFDDSKYVEELKKELAVHAEALKDEKPTQDHQPMNHSTDQGTPPPDASEFRLLVAEAHAMQLDERARKFVNEQHDRIAQYGAKASGTPKQIEWLKQIIAKGKKPVPSKHVLDDEIPF